MINLTFMKTLINFWDIQKECNNLQNCLIIVPIAIFSGIKYYQYTLMNSSLFFKVVFIIFLTFICLMIVIRPFMYYYKTENILTNLHNKSGNVFEIDVQPTMSTTFIGKFKLVKVNCASTSKATYVVVNNKLNNYKQGDKISLLIGANHKVIKIL